MPAGQTYDAIATNTISSSTTSFNFSSISSDYTDLILVTANCINTGGGNAYPSIRFNSDTGTNYSFTELYGNGTTSNSYRATNYSIIPLQFYTTFQSTSTSQITITHIMNYSNSTTYKTVLTRENNATDPNYPGTGIIAGLWRSTAAINTITVASQSFNFASGTFTLYGIKAA